MKNETLITWENENAKIIFAPLHGRIFQVEVDGEKAFWENENHNGDWNLGGDRLWISPENDYFWLTKGPHDFEKYQVPDDLCVNDWQVKENKNNLTLSKHIKFVNRHTLTKYEAHLSRSYRLAEAHDDDHWESVISFTTHDHLQIETGSEKSQKIDIWSILQIPGGGEISIPISEAKDCFQDYFSPTPDDHWRIEGDQLIFSTSGEQQYKTGVSAIKDGKITYRKDIGNSKQLVIIRSFEVQPPESYCDKPLVTSEEHGDIVQVYNDDGSLGNFGELEIHSKSIDFSGIEKSCELKTKTSVGIIKV